MEDIYNVTFDEASPVQSGANWLIAAASRMTYSLWRARDYLGSEMLIKFNSLLTLDTLWGVAIVLAAWGVSTVIGGPVATSINALLAVYGIYSIWSDVRGAAGLFMDWQKAALNAKSDDDIEQAAKICAKMMSNGGMVVIELFITHRAFRVAESQLRKRFPMPQWLKTKWGEKPGANRTKPVPEEAARTDALRGGLHRAGPVVAGVGAAHLASDLDMPTVAVGAGIFVATVAGVTLVALAARRNS